MIVEPLICARPPPRRDGESRVPPMRGQPEDFPLPELERLALACLAGLGPAMDHVDSWRAQGHGLEQIYLHGIAPCARLLGHWWVCDSADFGQVTIASANLQRVLYRLSEEFCGPGSDHPSGLSLLLVTEVQSQHTMGAFMLSEFFRRHGWSVQMLNPQDIQDVLMQLRRDWFDAVGLSLSTQRQVHALARWLPDVRAQSPNPGLCVMAGGPMAALDPQSLKVLGVDLLCGDAQDAVNRLTQMVSVKKN